jgi:hypothetical protein
MRTQQSEDRDSGVEYSRIEHSTAQHSTAQHSTAQHSTAVTGQAELCKVDQSKRK